MCVGACACVRVCVGLLCGALMFRVFPRHGHKQGFFFWGARWLRSPQQRPNARFVARNSASDNKPCWYHSTARDRSAMRLDCDAGVVGAQVGVPGITPNCCSPRVAATSTMKSGPGYYTWTRKGMCCFCGTVHARGTFVGTVGTV